jgi:hypothetical protein
MPEPLDVPLLLSYADTIDYRSSFSYDSPQVDGVAKTANDARRRVVVPGEIGWIKSLRQRLLQIASAFDLRGAPIGKWSPSDT